MIVLDTHVWIWFLSNPGLLSKKAKEVVNVAVLENGLIISSISAWEVALLVARKRLELSMEVSDWVSKSERLSFVRFVPVDNTIAIRSINLPEPFHRDPADRIIIATALSEGARLVTKDDKILNYPHVQTIW